MNKKPTRRKLLVGTTSSLALLSGCSDSEGDSGNSLQDSDGDGVIDSEDYAPRDPDVQEESDLKNTDTITPAATRADTTADETTPTQSPTPTSTPTPTATPTPTPTPTSTPTPTPTPEANELVVDDNYWQDQSRITSYSSRHVSVTVDPEFPETDFDRAKVVVGLSRFPREGTVFETLSSSFRKSSGEHEVTIEIPDVDIDTDEKYHYFVGLAPATATEDDLNYDSVKGVMESDPIEFDSDETTISRTRYDDELDSISGSSYSRKNIEGAYELEVEGRTRGQNWTVNFFAYKSAHYNSSSRSRGRSRPEYVNYELTNGTGLELANLLKDDADSLGFSEREAIEFVIDFVQALPYVPDDVSTGFDDYTKFIMETLPEMGGDCEDMAIMLASILSAEPFDYDMVLIQPPGHMAAGIWSSDPSGWYWEYDGRKYSYIEATGQGWGVGDCPEDYQGQDATIHQV